MAEIKEFDLFVEYGRMIKRFLQSNVYLTRFPEDQNVQVVYAAPPIAFAKYIVPVINGSNLNPTVSFNISGMEYAQNENLLGFVKETKRVNGKQQKMYAPLVYKLTYKATIMVANEFDADIIQYQIVSSAPFNRPYATKIDGQWATLYVAGMYNDTSIDVGEGKDKVIRRSVDLVIPRAYLPMGYPEINNKQIEEINLTYEI